MPLVHDLALTVLQTKADGCMSVDYRECQIKLL
jgi:hypothetical protein